MNTGLSICMLWCFFFSSKLFNFIDKEKRIRCHLSLLSHSFPQEKRMIVSIKKVALTLSEQHAGGQAFWQKYCQYIPAIQLTPLRSQCTVTFKLQYCTHACPMHPEKLANKLHSSCACELYSYLSYNHLFDFSGKFDYLED